MSGEITNISPLDPVYIAKMLDLPKAEIIEAYFDETTTQVVVRMTNHRRLKFGRYLKEPVPL